MGKIRGQRGTQSAPCPHNARKGGKPCGRDSRVVRTRRTPTGVVLRTRECSKGHRFSTEETPSA